MVYQFNFVSPGHMPALVQLLMGTIENLQEMLHIIEMNYEHFLRLEAIRNNRRPRHVRQRQNRPNRRQ